MDPNDLEFFHAFVREEGIADWERAVKVFRERCPEVYEQLILGPRITMRNALMAVDATTREKHNSLIAQMEANVQDSAKAKKLLLEARECLSNYPEAVKEFDEYYGSRADPTEVLEMMKNMQKAEKAEGSQQSAGKK